MLGTLLCRCRRNDISAGVTLSAFFQPVGEPPRLISCWQKRCRPSITQRGNEDVSEFRSWVQRRAAILGTDHAPERRA